MDKELTVVTHKYPKFKPSDGIDAVSYLGAWTSYRNNMSKMYIVNPDDEELMEYYKQFNDLTKSWLWKSDHGGEGTLRFKFGYPLPLSSDKPWQIILHIYSDEYLKKHHNDNPFPELRPKYKIVEYIPGNNAAAIMTKSQYQNEWEEVLWYIENTIADYATKKERVILMSSSPNDYMNRYFKDHYDRLYQKDPYLKWFDTVPNDDCTCTATAAELIWKKQKEQTQLGTAELTEKSDGLFVKMDYSNLSDMCKATLNQRFGLGLLSGDFDGDTLRYCKTDINTTLELFNQFEKENKNMENNKSKMKVAPFGGLAWLSIEKVIFNNEATIVIWNDGRKTIVKCQEGETFDKEKGLAMAICKRALGNTPYFNNYFKKWISEATVETPKKKKSKEKKVEETATEEITEEANT